MKITESQLRRIVREEIIRESIHDDRFFHAGNSPYQHGNFLPKDPSHVQDAFRSLVDRTGNDRIMLSDILAEMEAIFPGMYPELYNEYLNYEGPSFISPGFFTGTGLMLNRGAVEINRKGRKSDYVEEMSKFSNPRY